MFVFFLGGSKNWRKLQTCSLDAERTHGKVNSNSGGNGKDTIVRYNFPYHPWDWYINLHLIDFYGKCR